MVGKGVLLECLDHPEISKVLSVSRRSLNIDHPTLRELIHKDFSEFVSVSEHLKGYDACYACMGVSSVGMKEAEYTRLTYDFALALARELYKMNPEMTFTYVSGQGTDSSEKGRSMWARVKGKTENDLLKVGFRQAFMFRPGAIIPVKGVQPSSKLYRILVTNLSWLPKLIKKISPDSVVNSAQIGQAMINASRYGYTKNVLGPKDIQIMANTSN
jgi:hypothetical protein